MSWIDAIDLPKARENIPAIFCCPTSRPRGLEREAIKGKKRRGETKQQLDASLFLKTRSPITFFAKHREDLFEREQRGYRLDEDVYIMYSATAKIIVKNRCCFRGARSLSKCTQSSPGFKEKYREILKCIMVSWCRSIATAMSALVFSAVILTLASL